MTKQYNLVILKCDTAKHLEVGHRIEATVPCSLTTVPFVMFRLALRASRIVPSGWSARDVSLTIPLASSFTVSVVLTSVDIFSFSEVIKPKIVAINIRNESDPLVHEAFHAVNVWEHSCVTSLRAIVLPLFSANVYWIPFLLTSITPATSSYIYQNIASLTYIVWH